MTIDSFAYTHDNVGNRLTRTDTTGTHSYQYDFVYELTQAAHPASTEAFAYDPVGNRLTETRDQTVINYTHNALNQTQSRDGETYAYDLNGNMISKVNGAGTTTYEYDYENRLKKATLPDGTITEYKYDPFGRRIEEKVTVSGVSAITRNLYDGDNILNEYDENNVLLAGYIHNLGIDDPLSIEKNGSMYYYHKDGLGSVTALTDATGSKVRSYEYDSFGSLLSQTGTVVQPYTYTGREYDPETGLYYYRARYYDAKLGRFISKDPIGFAGGDVNVYNYTSGNPVNWVDPTGLLTSAGALAHYLSGGGTSLNMQFNEINTATVKAVMFPQVLSELVKGGCDRTINIYEAKVFATSGDAAVFLGFIKLHLQGTLTISNGTWVFRGKLSSSSDLYDFNPSHHRTTAGEFSTTLGSYLPGTPYRINIIGEKVLTQSGRIRY